jgi:hypothetical protein
MESWTFVHAVRARPLALCLLQNDNPQVACRTRKCNATFQEDISAEENTPVTQVCGVCVCGGGGVRCELCVCGGGGEGRGAVAP